MPLFLVSHLRRRQAVLRLPALVTALLLTVGIAAFADDGDVAARIIRVEVSDAQTGNEPLHSVDGDTSTRWSANGSGNWIAYELDRPVRFDRVELGYISGDQRVYRFDIEVSDDGDTWQRIHRGESSGDTEQPEPHTFDAAEAEHVRLVHRGNSENDWVNLHTFAIPNVGIADDLGAESGPTPITGPTGLVASLWADETQIAAPIAISIDHDGRAYVTQTTRRRGADVDIRNHRDWVRDELSFQSVEDKRTFYRDNVDDYDTLTEPSDYVHLIEDTDGDGRADRSHIFADDFRTEITGVAGGVMWHDDNVYLTIAPDVWQLRDTDGDDRADDRRSISHGYGVHIAYAGHGMSGMAVGPDGRIYWSHGDIGHSITTEDGRKFHHPNRGAVLRSEPDGSNVEIFAVGLRNTHEIAFDKYGNLFSVDNDGDFGGERERTVYIVEQGEYGWRSNWQYRNSSWTDMPHDQTPYNPWMAENLLGTHDDDRPAYVLPAVAHYSDGPTGFVYNPGTALNGDYEDFFFLSQFPGEILTAFRFEPDGAGFEMTDEHVAHRGILGTGLAFGPDGALYMNDWIEGWVPRDDGRIWRIDDPDAAETSLREQTRQLLGEGMGDRAEDALVDLLDHPDMRVRREAQFELVKRDERSRLQDVALDADRPQLARIHALWGLGQLGRRDGFDDTEALLTLLADDDAELRAQAAQFAGDVDHTPAADRLAEMLEDDPSPRAQFHAGLALWKVGDRESRPAAVAMLEANDDTDAYLRHAGIMALLASDHPDDLIDLAEHDSVAVRRAAVVALRRLEEPGVSVFLADSDERVAAEAARAIHDDFSIPAALPPLAEALRDQADWQDEALLRRAINANLRVGEAENAAILAAYAARPDAPEAMRIEALATLAVWPAPDVLDRVEGRYRELEPGDPATVRAALDEHHAALTSDETPAAIRTMLAHAAGDVAWRTAATALVGWLEDHDQPASLRRAALNALGRMNHEELGEAVATALEDPDDAVRSAARELLSDLDAEAAVVALTAVLETGSTDEQQQALATLAEVDDPAAARTLEKWMDRLLAGDVPDALALDILEAAGRRDTPSLREKVAAYEQQLENRLSDDPLAPHRLALAGGDTERGEQVFMEHLAAACARCHTLGDRGGEGEGEPGTIAPDLSDVGSRLDRHALLESLILPNAAIAEGYGTATVTTTGGRTVTGTLREERDDTLIITTTEGEDVEVPKDEIQNRSPQVSMMPPMGDILSRQELRDVIAFLATLKDE